MLTLRGYTHRIIIVLMVAVFLYTDICAAVPNGDFNGDGKVSVVDALLALRIVVGLDQATTLALERCDIAPVDANGTPHPDSRITLEDALYVLQKSLSLPSWQIPSNVTVPNIVGQTQAAAQFSLNFSLLSTGTITTQSSASVASGNVISQNPAAAVSVAPGTAVNLVVSTGPAPDSVPNVVGQTQSAAQSAITASGLMVGTITSQVSATVASGNVISQNPAAGSSVAFGTAVNLVVSTRSAQVSVPNVVGQTQAAAQSAITTAGLMVGTMTKHASTTIDSGNVISQDPVAGTPLPAGTSVNLVVSSGPASVSIPDVTGLTRQAAVDALVAKGYQLGTATSVSNATVTSGSVISQNPAAGIVASAGVAVAIVVSIGPPVATITVPKVTGLVQASAQSALTDAALVAGTMSQDTSATVPSGTVISQYPPTNAKAVSGSAVALVVSSGPALSAPVPPDPATIATPLDSTASTSLVAATAFLYSGSNSIQTGVPAGTIEIKRAAVLRGKVMDSDNQPLSGVNITVKDHPEFGQTHTRADGGFDLAVNGGGYLTITYQKNGYLPSQRQVNAPWQDYAWLPEVILIQLDSRVTAVDLASGVPIQAVQGNPVTDADGTRQATLLIRQGTTAQMVLPDGRIIPLTTLNIRATEYTAGESGPKAMPGQLPATSAYTYAVEFSADEAIAAGATRVSFDQPIYTYVDDFIGFPVGSAVPAGYYDRQKGQWISSQNGRVIKILSITAAMADLDLDGTGSIANAAALALLNITDAERAKLASLYPTAPKQLWRVPITHFTPWDCNWPYGPPPDASPPPPISDLTMNNVDDPCTQPGSIIECQNRVLGESVLISGTPYSLNYRSNRTPGFTAARNISVKVSGASVPASLMRIDVTLSLAGRQIVQSLPGQANQVFNYIWDGRDCFGRTVGSSTYTIQVAYVYQVVYYPVSSDLANAFARVQGASGTPGITGNSLARTIFLTQTCDGVLRSMFAEFVDLPYWSLDVHHSYDPASRTIYYGSGEQVDARQIPGGDGIETIASSWNGAHDLALAPDGSLYYGSFEGSSVQRIGPDGTISTVAGDDGTYGFSGDGGPATSAMMDRIRGVAVGADGSLYIIDIGNQRIRKVGPDGIITTVAGNGINPATGSPGFGGDGGPATAAYLYYPSGVAIAGDGTIYISDSGNHRVRKVGPDGIISTIAGNGEYPSVNTGDGGRAIAGAEYPWNGIVVSGDGKVYYSDNYRVRMVGTDGIVITVAGNGIFDYAGGMATGDGGPATAATLLLDKLALGSDGSLYVNASDRIRKVTPDGIISTVAGGGTSQFASGKSARSVALNTSGIAISSNGTIYSTYCSGEACESIIYRIRPIFPEFSAGGLLIASESWAELYQFDSNGKHLRTLNALTGAVLLSFGYDVTGRLTSIIDANGAVSSIERDASGAPLAIVAPFGQRTLISLDANGHVASITNPAGESHRMTYTADGLLTSLRNPAGATSNMTYDAKGLLLRDTDTQGGFWDIVGITTPTGPLVSMTSAMNRSTTYLTEQLATGDQRRTITDPGGAVTLQVRGANGVITTTGPDGNITTTTLKPDPRFGMMRPLSDSSVRLPSGLTRTSATNRSAVLSDTTNPLTLTSQTTTTAVNGKTYTSTYDASLKKYTSTTPVGRTSQSTIDYLGRPVSLLVDPTLTPVSFNYNAQGFPVRISQGTSSISYGYDASGRKASTTNALNQTVSYGYDAAGRVNRLTLASGRAYQMGYNANGQMTSLTMPNGSVHAKDYTLLGMDKGYTPPANNLYSWFYNLDRDWTQSKLPGGRTIDAGYDAGGRLTALVYPEASVDYLYAPGDRTGRISAIVRTPTGGGTAQRITYTYDGSLLTQNAVSGVTTGTTSYSYDNNFLLSAINMTSGADTFNSAIVRDDDGLITRFGPFSYTRSGPTGAVSAISDLTLNLTFGYDSFGRLSGKTYTVNSVPFFQSTYTYDVTGRISNTTETISGASKHYAYMYDADGQVIERKENGVTLESYAYDLNGNRIGYIHRGPISFSLTASYDAQDRIVEQGRAPYAFDVDGYLTSSPIVDNCQYSAQGELLSTVAWGQNINYTYDGIGRRVARSNRTGTYQYFYSNPDQPFQVSAVRDPVGEFTAFYYDPSGGLFAFKRGTSIYYVASDHLGTPRVVTDVAGTVVRTMGYDSYGFLHFDSNSSFDLPIGFAGGIPDTTGLVRFGFRDYEPASGRWVSRDPILYQSGQANLYQYVKNNSVNLIDPTGLDWFRPKADPYVVGRENSQLVEPGKGIGKFIDDYVPAGHTFGTLHDDLVDMGREAGLPDALINIPTMLGMYALAVGTELDNSLYRLLRKKPLLVCH